jgi:hypothetical protein
MNGRQPVPAADLSFPSWKAEAVRLLAKLHERAATTTRDSFWARLYVRGLDPDDRFRPCESLLCHLTHLTHLTHPPYRPFKNTPIKPLLTSPPGRQVSRQVRQVRQGAMAHAISSPVNQAQR